MELTILNIGLERGIITPLLFTVMVIMAIVTTLMTSPIFEWVYPRQAVTAAGSSTIALPNAKPMDTRSSAG